MAIRVYKVTITTPEEGESYSYDAVVERHGVPIAEIKGPLVPLAARISNAICGDIEREL